VNRLANALPNTYPDASIMKVPGSMRMFPRAMVRTRASKALPQGARAQSLSFGRSGQLKTLYAELPKSPFRLSILY
jgi:hypothetical protein